MHYLLFYDYVPDYIERRKPLRADHLAYAWAAVERGELVLGGALADPPDSAALLFSVKSTDVIEAFIAADPYVVHGLVTGWRMRPWTTVVGKDAATPVSPSSC
jgi:uncharacterized protein YciI